MNCIYLLLLRVRTYANVMRGISLNFYILVIDTSDWFLTLVSQIRHLWSECKKNVSFWGPYLSWKHFSYPPPNLSRQGASFTHPYDFFFLSDDFMTKKVAKLVETQKFCQNRLNHSFLLGATSSHFFIWWIFRTSAFLIFFELF